MTEAGFADPKKVSHGAMLFGNIAYYRAIAYVPGHKLS
jgi:hypothetical protein